MSHTVTVKVVLKDKQVLGISVQKMEGEVLGEGTHILYSGPEHGWGFTLPRWKYPLVLRESGDLAFDDYKGVWGNLDDLARLRETYALETARRAATAQGWLSEDVASGLLIHHPDGGTLTVARNGTVDANGFLGTSCAIASGTIQNALGLRETEDLKSEFYEEQVAIRQTVQSM